MGSVTVTKSGHCDGYKWSIKWLQGGNKNLMKVEKNSLLGVNPNVSTVKSTNGGVVFRPILDNMVRTFHTVPQVNTTKKFHTEISLLGSIAILSKANHRNQRLRN